MQRLSVVPQGDSRSPGGRRSGVGLVLYEADRLLCWSKGLLLLSVRASFVCICLI